MLPAGTELLSSWIGSLILRSSLGTWSMLLSTPGLPLPRGGLGKRKISSPRTRPLNTSLFCTRSKSSGTWIAWQGMTLRSLCPCGAQVMSAPTRVLLLSLRTVADLTRSVALRVRKVTWMLRVKLWSTRFGATGFCSTLRHPRNTTGTVTVSLMRVRPPWKRRSWVSPWRTLSR